MIKEDLLVSMKSEMKPVVLFRCVVKGGIDNIGLSNIFGKLMTYNRFKPEINK